ncbi:MAG: CRTAC1 family protein [Thermoanaerobaculia bacterium]
MRPRVEFLVIVLAGVWALLPLAADPAAAELRFREVSEEWGVPFRHHHGGSGRRYMVETMIGGLAVLDYDSDGDQDLLFVDGRALPGYEGEPGKTTLYRNEGGGRFVDRTTEAGLSTEVYGSGAAVADIDGDRDVDVYVTAFGRNLLYQNDGDGTFTENASAWGLDDPAYGAGAAFADADLDGDLDLYVSNYVVFSLELHNPCIHPESGVEGYCRGTNYDSARDLFLRNLGSTFENQTDDAGFDSDYAPGLGVVFSDFDADGYPDIYVANDGAPNFLYRNLGDGTFEDDSLLSGTAFSNTGAAEGGMGVALGDIDGNGLSDLLVSNFELETNALYTTQGANVFADARFIHGVAEPSLLMVGFGTVFDDLDNDGDLDLLVANGHVLDNPKDFQIMGDFRQPNHAYENIGHGRFRLEAEAGLSVVRSSRGLATGDLDGDGDLDFAINNSNDRCEVYENLTADLGRQPDAAWLEIDLEGDRQTAAVGAHVYARAGAVTARRVAHAGDSYLSQSSSTLHFGLGEATAIDLLEVRWPLGRLQRFAAVPARHRIRLYERPPLQAPPSPAR